LTRREDADWTPAKCLTLSRIRENGRGRAVEIVKGSKRAREGSIMPRGG
jgi:hypothetical protein